MANEKEATLLLRIKTAGEALIDGARDKFDELGKVIVSVYTQAAAMATKAILSYKEQEQATNSLNQAMVQQGIFTAKLRDEYLAQADALSKTSAYGDEAIVKAQAIAQANLGQIPITKELTKGILDYAAATGKDLNSAAEAVTKSIGTSTNALARNGITVSETATKSEKMAQVLTQLNSKFGGQAEAAVQGLGSLDKLKNSVGELFEQLGERLAPVVNMVANALNSLARDTTTTNSVLDGMVSVFQFLTKAGAYVMEGFIGLSQIIGTVLAGSVEAISLAMKGQFSRAKEIVSMGVDEVANIAVARGEALNAKLDAIDKAFIQTKQQNRQQDLANQQQSNAMADEIATVEADKQFITEETRRQEMQALKDSYDLAELGSIGTHGEAVTQAKMAILDKQIANETNYHVKADLLRQKAAQQELLLEQMKAKQKEQYQRDSFATIATLSQSNNATLASIGKAAGITQIAIDTPVAVSKALAAFPPPFNFVAAGLVGAAMAAQAARIAGVQLAEGGIVRGTPGGIQATIGEGGQDEAVIPLDRAGSIGGNNISIVVYGGLLGDETTAHQFAIAVDRKLLELRQNNESVAFDEGIM